MKKKRKTRSGNNLRASISALLLIVAGCLAAPAAFAGAKKEAKPAESNSVVAGAVFREPGFALPGAEVTISPAEDEASGKKARKMTFTANTRGEFAFRLPPIKANYTVSVSAKGFVGQQKTVAVQAGERVDVTFVLAAESNR